MLVNELKAADVAKVSNAEELVELVFEQLTQGKIAHADFKKLVFDASVNASLTVLGPDYFSRADIGAAVSKLVPEPKTEE